MRIEIDEFRVRERDHVDLEKRATCVRAVYRSEDHLRDLLQRHVSQLSDVQQILYAANRYSVLIILQGMDTAGKGSAIKHVMSGVNPQGCQVHSFKHPTVTELERDFLWRTARFLPERGQIGIFNRSYYEEVLIVRVHPEILESEGVPSGQTIDGQVWHDRFHSINELERHLARNNTRIIKIFLHLSKDEQRKRFLARIDQPDKSWKFSADDIAEREYWDQYMLAYEACLGATSTAFAPWYIVPADDKNNAHLIISQIILDAFGSMELAYPVPNAARQAELQSFRARLAG
ncbi:ADP-polyphosphate phosphotransferase [Brucella anthropi]